jgi:hypothetical protein
MVNTPSSNSQLSRKTNYWLIIPVIAVVLIGALMVGFWIGSRSPSNQQPTGTQTNQGNQTPLTIASFKTKILENNSIVRTYLDLEIHGYWVEGNKVRCDGTIKWQTTQYTIEGLSVALTISRAESANSVNAEVIVYSGLLYTLEPSTGGTTIDTVSVSVPKLGNQTSYFDFSLTCTYHQ